MKPVVGLLVGMFFFVGSWVNGQTPVCKTPAPDLAYRKALLALEKQYLRQRAGTRLSEEITDVAVKVNIMLRKDGLQLFTKTELDTSFAYLNRLFLPSGIRFHLDGEINYVKNDRWATVTYDQEIEEMRRNYDVKHAVNLYIVTQGRSSSFAFLPDFSSISNCIFISAQVFNEDLYKYLLPHEFGHFFGLSHTFGIGNEPELVTRGPEANCETTGDWICDTPADPYPFGNCSRGTDPATGKCLYRCVEKDARGDTYNTDFNNIMSYYPPYVCPGGFHFTAGQYLRMKVGLQARLRDNCREKDRYSITGALPTTYITTDSVYIPNADQGFNNPLLICRKATAVATFSPMGEFESGNEFKVAISEAYGPMFRPLIEVPAILVAGKTNTLSFSVPEELKTNVPYSVQVTSTKPYSAGCLGGKMLQIVDTPTMRLSFVDTPAESVTVGFGGLVPLRVKAEGEGYQKATLRINDRVTTFFEGGVTSWKEVEVDYQAPIRFFKTSTVRIHDLKVQCSYANSIGQLSVVVRPPLLKTQLLAGLLACPGQNLTVLYQSDVPPDLLTSDYQLQLSDETGRFLDDSTRIIGQTRTNSFQAVLPANLPVGNGYRTRIILMTPQGRVVGEPSEPLTIRAKPQATLTSESVSMYVGDSTRLTITLTGESPWSYTLSSGHSFTASQSPATVVVKPVETTDYRLTGVQNSCGPGTVSGLTTVTVLKPLGVNPVYAGKLTLRLWPNPVKNRVFVEWTAQPGRPVNLAVLNLKGQVLQTRTVTGTGLAEQTEIEASALPTGQFTIVASDGTSRQMVRFIRP